LRGAVSRILAEGPAYVLRVNVGENGEYFVKRDTHPNESEEFLVESPNSSRLLPTKRR